FDKPESAKLKGAKALKEVGEYLQANPFGLAVVRCSAGPKGDSEKTLVLTEARAMVIRDYLAQNFKIDDTRLKTMGLGKSNEEGEGTVEVLVFPVGTEAPGKKSAPPGP